MSFEAFTALTFQVEVFWVVMPCGGAVGDSLVSNHNTTRGQNSEDLDLKNCNSLAMLRVMRWVRMREEWPWSLMYQPAISQESLRKATKTQLRYPIPGQGIKPGDSGM
jgi:hypothetical protein